MACSNFNAKEGGDDMRTNALHSFFGGSGSVNSKRMDCVGPKNRRGDTGFAMENTGPKERIGFKKVLADVAGNNVMAHNVTGKTIAKWSSENNAKLRRKEADMIAGNRIPEELLSGDFAGLVDALQVDFSEHSAEVQTTGELELIDENAALEAQEIVTEALSDIADTLGLSIFPDLENVSLREIGSDVKAQFSEIVFVLKKLLQGFEWSRASGVPVETPKMTIESGSIDTVTQVLQTCTFKIEMACRVLGISESVQQEVALQLELTSSTGIIQASDPSTIKMAAHQSERLFDSLFTASSKEVSLSVIVDRIKALLAEGGETSNPVISVGGKGSSTGQGDLQQFNASVYRALLKIDAVAKTTVENGKASGKIEGLELPKTPGGSVTLAQSIAETLGAEGNTADDGATVLDMHLAGAQKPADGIGQEARIPASLLKMADETVMGQLTERLQSVIRSGLSEIRIQLRPESLGEVQMRLQMEGDLLVAKIDVENQQVKEIMERNLPMLKDALAQQNITTGSFDIQVGSGLGRHQGGAQHAWEQEQVAHNNQADREHGDENDDESGDRRQTHDDTGRRYGNNSVEFFA